MSDDEFIIHASLVEWFRWFKRDGVVFFIHPPAKSAPKESIRRPARLTARAGPVCSGWDCAKAFRIS